MNSHEYARLETVEGEALMFKGLKATGELRGLLLEMCVEQSFCNLTDKNVEVVYTFPLPWGAVLLGVDVQLGDLHLTGAVVEKRQAEASYEAALSEGDAAIMLERNRDHSYSLNLGNLAVQEVCVITMRYAQTLQFEQRGLRLLIPTVIAPRYGDAVTDGGLQPHQTYEHSSTLEYPFDITLNLHGDLSRARVSSPSHPIGVAHQFAESGDVLTVTLGRMGALDRDFVLVIDQLIHDSLAILAHDYVDLDAVVAQVSFCPRIPVIGASTTAVKILVDCSGSMNGDSIAAARRALQAIVKQLNTGDRFSLSRFGSTVEHRSRGLWVSTETTRTAAQRWVGKLQADLGGTEMELALASTFALAKTVNSDVLIVTDGEISAIDSTIKTAKASGQRLFVVGIGSSPAESHLRRLAEETGGACDFVTSCEAVEPAVLRMFARLRSPKLTDISVVWPEGTPPEWHSTIAASVFDGDTLNVFALLRNIPVGEVKLTGARTIAGTSEVIGSAVFSPCPETGNTLSRIAAAQRLQAMVGDESVSAKATDLAVAYQLVTDQTNFLLVHERAEADKASDMPELHKVKPMLPAGWGGTAQLSGSIEADASCLPMFSCAQIDAPTIMRSGSRARLGVSDISSSSYDIPMFLRKSVGGVPRNPESARDNEGMTPMELNEWLRAKPRSVWPTRYDQLRQIGVGASLTDWLELVMAHCGKKVFVEKMVVETFLFVMSQSTFRAAMVKSLGFMGGVKEIGNKIKGVLAVSETENSPSVDLELVGKMRVSLADMTAYSWPDSVYALVAV
jgi:Ca-activated chloride channel family protein